MRQVKLVLGALLLAVVAACVQQALAPVEVETLARPVTYVKDVKPVLDRRCVVCHSCYNAPCQVQLGSHEGIERGGSKVKVYDSTRLSNQSPTRLFIDASSAAEWRTKGFYSVTESTAGGAMNDSLMLQLLAQKRQHPQLAGEYHSQANDLTCAADSTELGAFLAEHPDRGMPFGFPGLPDDEYQVLATWLQRGANAPHSAEDALLEMASPDAQMSVGVWEAFLNTPDAKHAMTARYLYEHFFLAHIVFPEADRTQFFRLVRSQTPPGEPIREIATVRPYDPTRVDEYWYRFRRIRETIVHKTHMVREFTPTKLARLQELFIETPWLEEPHFEALGDRSGANPFLVYAQIPPEVRYRFLLEDSDFFIQSLMQGPVCNGQVALNVINDHFWVMFLDPEADLTVQHPDFLLEQAGNLRLPNEKGSDPALVKSFSDAYRKRYTAFYSAKVGLYEALAPEGPALDDIWAGARPTDTPMLTVYRHFDSASLHVGALGALPRTVWVMDYSQLERIYYALVAGFDVFGNLSHQVSVRRYMDYLRMEGELNFLAFMPKDARLPLLLSWYIGDSAIEDVGPDAVLPPWGTQVPYETDDLKRELVEMVVDDHLLADLGVSFDGVNYRRAGHTFPPMPTSFHTREEILDGFRALTKPGVGFIQHVTSFDVNVIFVRFMNLDGKDHFVSIVINRWHDNVNSMFGEKKRLDSSKDTMDFHRGGIGSYPNYFFEVDAQDIGAFFDMLENFDGSPEYVAAVRRFGVERSEPRFWDSYDWFQDRLDASDPVRAGLYDLNRYYPVADVGEPKPTPGG